MPVFYEKKGVAYSEPLPQNEPAQSLRRRGRLIDPVKENQNTKMLKKYTKYVATAFAVASLSTFMIGCGGEGDTEEETGTGTTEGAGETDTNNPAPGVDE